MAYPGIIDIAANVRAEVARARIPQTRIADVLNLSQSQVSRKLAGQSPFVGTELGVLAREIGVPVGTFYGEAPQGGEGA